MRLCNLRSFPTENLFSRLVGLFVMFALADALETKAQDHTLTFSTTDAGISRSITNWGLDTCWPNYDNMLRGLIYMGTNKVNMVRVGFVIDAPLTNNDLSTSQKSSLQTFANLANMATAATRWDMNMASSVDPWYQSGTGTVYPDRWAAAIQAAQRYYNRSFWMVEGFNEPDYGWGQGSQQNLYDVFGYLQASTNFPGTFMAGGSTLNNDTALSWFNAVSSRVSVGTTHSLAGTVSTYVSFLQAVTASNAIPFNPELHNVVEAIIGANYGLKGGIWWGSAELARGSFVKACQGTRLGYSEDWSKWTAASVYRGTNNAVQGFVGASERMATTTSYRFFSKDRDVFYDGYGPQRDYTVTIPGGTGYMTSDQRNAEKVVNITWGSDIQPAINGRYIVVNRNSGKALEVPGANTNNGIVLTQNTYTGALNQQWDINPLPERFGGDYSYFTMKAGHDGVTADLNNWSYANGAVIEQWNGGTNTLEQWYFEYVGNGYFKIRNRWSNKVMGVNGSSTSNGAQILQWDDNGTLDHEWRLIPATVSSYNFVAPAAPTQVTATANEFSVQLNWKTNSESDFSSYSVLRATNSGGPYEICARALTNNAFTDKSANQSKTYFYVIKAVDSSLNTSINSAQVSTTPTCGPAVVARYSFDGNSNDSSTNANHPIIVNNSPTFVSGKYGSAMDLSGTNQYTMLPANMLASVTNFTIALWVNWDGGSAWQRIFDFGNDATQYMFLTPSSGGGTLRFVVSTNSYFSEQILETSPLPVGQWRHVAITRNGNITLLYTNGVLAASNSITIAPSSFNPALNYLGDSQYETDPLFNGRLDELYIYNLALSSAEIGRLMTNQPLPTVPALVTATPGSGQAAVIWTTSVGASSYNVKRSVSIGGPYTTIGAAIVTTNYIDSAVTNGVTYFYVVSGNTAVGESANSSPATATFKPDAPTGLTAVGGDGQVALNWNSALGASSYNIKRSITSGGPYTTITNMATTSFLDLTVTNGSTYRYVVSALNSAGESGNSTESSAAPVSLMSPQMDFEILGTQFHAVWPADHRGWRMESNSASLTATGMWFTVPGSSSTNELLLPLNKSISNVFFRLVFP